MSTWYVAVMKRLQGRECRGEAFGRHLAECSGPLVEAGGGAPFRRDLPIVGRQYDRRPARPARRGENLVEPQPVVKNRGEMRRRSPGTVLRTWKNIGWPVRAYEFGPFRLDVPNRLLLRAGVVVALKPKVIDTLLVLLENHGRVMTKDELMQALWPDRFVEQANLTQSIYALRIALNERQAPTPYIETMSRRGYRFAGDVRTVVAEASLRSLAVLPFTSLSDDGTDAPLALGIADALITTLGNSGLVIVRPISASRRYVGPRIDPIEVARALVVDAVLDGSIQRSGDTIRVTARLIRATDGATLWADRYQEAMTSIFEVQDSIADKITAALEVARSGGANARLAKRYTTNVEAYQLYLNGRYNWNRSTEEGLRAAIVHFTRAIAIDPQFALAYVGIADAYTALDWYGVLSTRDSNPHAFAAAQEALRLDVLRPTLRSRQSSLPHDSRSRTWA